MFDKIKNNDLVITNNKKAILDYLDRENKLLNLKIMTKQEFMNHYFGYTNEKAIYYLVEKYHYKFDVAKMYLENFLFDENLFKEFDEQNLILRTPLLKESISRIVVIDVFIDKFLMREIEKYDYLIFPMEKRTFIPQVREFVLLDEEVEFIACSIRDLLKKVAVDKIFIVLESNEYLNTIKRIFKLYGIPISTNESKNIYGTFSVRTFLKVLKETRDIPIALDSIKADAIYNAIVEVCNKYQFRSLDDTIIYLIEEELKQKQIRYKQVKDAVSVISINQITEADGYYFVLSFNEGILPKTYKDEDYLCDSEKQKIGLFTSYEKNKNSKENVINKITGFKNMVLTYKLKFQAVDYYPSSLIEELGFDVIKESDFVYTYSNAYNKLKLSRMLDEFIKYNKTHKDLGLLLYNYPKLSYLTYDNQYKNIDITTFRKYIGNQQTLSYSSLDNFYHCKFRFYLTHILKLDKYEETFMTFIGTLFHDVLSVAFLDNFDFEKVFASLVSEKEFTPKEEFFISRLKLKLKEVILIIKEQDKNSALDSGLYENKITVNKKDEIDVQFVGIIDKIKYKEFDGKKIVSVIDYKTGTPHIELNHLYYGLSMQLPIYLYLLKYLFTEDIEIAGFYLQKIIQEKLSFQKGRDYDREMTRLYRLEGFSNDDESILEKFDASYQDSQMIKGMKVSSKGFYPYTKVLSKEQMDKMIAFVDNKIEEAIQDIQNANFTINPKVIDNKNIGCEFCKFRDICYVNPKDLVSLKSVCYEEFLGTREKQES